MEWWNNDCCHSPLTLPIAPSFLGAAIYKMGRIARPSPTWRDLGVTAYAPSLFSHVSLFYWCFALPSFWCALLLPTRPLWDYLIPLGPLVRPLLLPPLAVGTVDEKINLEQPVRFVQNNSNNKIYKRYKWNGSKQRSSVKMHGEKWCIRRTFNSLCQDARVTVQQPIWKLVDNMSIWNECDDITDNPQL
jgi:hypothetical protein